MTKGKNGVLKRKRSSHSSKEKGNKRVKVDDIEEQKIENPKIFSEEALQNLKIYNELKTDYEEEGVNQNTHQFLTRISCRKIKENPNLNKCPLMLYLSNAAKIMMMNEIEIAAWAVWLDELNLGETGFSKIEDDVLNTAFFIKMLLNDEAYYHEMFQSYFNCYMNSFINKFNEWVKDKNFHFDPILVNRKFKELNKPYNPAQDKDFLDYNNVVDDILQISPPYNYCNDKKSKNGHNSKGFEAISNGPSQLQVSQIFNSQIDASQRSIVPTKKPIKTLKLDGSPQQLRHIIPADAEIAEIEKSLAVDQPQMITRLSKKKSSVFSIKDIQNTTQRKINNDDLFNRPVNQSQSLSQFHNLYGLNHIEEGDNANPYDLPVESLFGSNSQNAMARNNSRITRSIARKPTVGFGKSLSGFSNISGSNDYNVEGQNLFSQLHGGSLTGLGQGLVRFNANDMNRFELDENQIKDLPDMPMLSSRGNSYQQMLKNDQTTPSLFRVTSGIINPKLLKKNN